MKIASILSCLESFAPSTYQEDYDNAGLLTGDPEWECTGVLCTLDSTEEVVQEAIHLKCNLIVAHHPIIFTALKRINGKNYVERTVIRAIKNDIAIFAIHTNLDNILNGVNGKIADLLQLTNRKILSSKSSTLKKLFTFVPVDHVEQVRKAVFEAGVGNIGNYSECSFNAEGVGTFKANEHAKPFVGEMGQRHQEKEMKIEAVFPSYAEQKVVRALLEAHPYEAVAYDIIELSNPHPSAGSGLLGELPKALEERAFLDLIKKVFRLEVIRHTAFIDRPLQRIALCGGSGSFLISKALTHQADVYITADMKYHEFFDSDRRMLICDIGHFESEQFTTDLLADILQEKFPTFAVLKSGVQTNPVHYYF